MNQILMTEDNKPREEKNNNTVFNSNFDTSNMTLGAKIQSIIKGFAISIIIFGLALIGSGSYAVYAQAKENRNYSIPTISAERKGNQVILYAKNEIGIRNLSYSWNSSNQETIIEGKNQTEVKATINIIPGNNKLNVKVVDGRGRLIKYEPQNYIQVEQDVTEPEVEVSSEGAKLKITATDDTQMSYMTYKYGENAPVKVDADEDDPTTITAYVEDILQQQVTLFVEAVDSSNNTKTYEQKIMGVTRPTIKVVPDPADPDYLIITVTADEGLRMVVFYINSQQYQTDPNVSLNSTKFEYRIKAEKDADGKTMVKVNAYSMTEQIQEFKGEYRH